MDRATADKFEGKYRYYQKHIMIQENFAGWNVIWYNHRHREFPAEGNRVDITANTAEELLEVLKNECI